MISISLHCHQIGILMLLNRQIRGSRLNLCKYSHHHKRELYTGCVSSGINAGMQGMNSHRFLCTDWTSSVRGTNRLLFCQEVQYPDENTPCFLPAFNAVYFTGTAVMSVKGSVSKINGLYIPKHTSTSMLTYMYIGSSSIQMKSLHYNLSPVLPVNIYIKQMKHMMN